MPAGRRIPAVCHLYGARGESPPFPARACGEAIPALWHEVHCLVVFVLQVKLANGDEFEKSRNELYRDCFTFTLLFYQGHFGIWRFYEYPHESNVHEAAAQVARGPA